MTAHAESMLPLILRLNALEAKVDGANIYPETDYRKDGPTKNGESSKTALRRVQGIQETLERIGGNNEALRRFIDNYDTYLPLLSMPDPSSSSTTNGDILDPAKDTAGVVSDYDLIPDKVKVTMLLEAAADIKGLERDLREVEVLKGRGVEGAGQLEDLLPLRPELANADAKSNEYGRNLDQARQQTTELLTRYNDYTNALSDLFLDVHRRLEDMEEAVGRAERRKRKEMAERY